MITQNHTVNDILTRNFPKEYLSDVSISDLQSNTKLNEFNMFLKEFNIMRKPLVRFFKFLDVKPLHILLDLIGPLGPLPKTFCEFEEIIHRMYNMIELFIYKFDINLLTKIDVDLFDMFFKEMWQQYIHDINMFNKTIEHIINIDNITHMFILFKSRLTSNKNFRDTIDNYIENDIISTLNFPYINNTNFHTIGIYDFPMRLIYTDYIFKNTVLRFTKNNIDIVLHDLFIKDQQTRDPNDNIRKFRVKVTK
jgi:hypothetical protein